MEKHFVTYNQALALKELGFDEPCIMYIDDEGDLINDDTAEWIRAVKCPLKSQVFEWFREKYELHSTITSISQESWQWHIQKPGQQLGKLYNEDFYTYEEAESACIDKLIELLQHDK